MTGHLSLVSVGPGDLSLVPERARRALQDAEVVVAYDLYLTWVRPLLTTQEVLTPPLTQEKYRAQLAIQKAQEGRRVALVSSGDIGVYAMAGLVFEELPEQPGFGVEVIPGITSATACASLLGSPLTHDFATLSLSDLLCPWAWIETRARHIAQADLACVLYNVQSRSRREGIYRVLRLMLEHKRRGTVCGVVRNAYREGQEVRVTTLEALLHDEFDMLTTIVIGNRFTTRKGRWMYTPRGYNDWQPERAGEPLPAPPPTPEGTVWVFSGTRDGNALALWLAEMGQPVTLSVASDLGATCAPRHPKLHLYSGPSGVEARRRALRGARAVVDATHPYAQAITAQLRELTAELGVSYLRYERPSGLPGDTDGMILVDSFEEAARAAAPSGRVFLATGSKDLEAFLQAAPSAEGGAEVFVRLTPQPDVLRRAQELGVPTAHICAMIGPFSREFNAAQWRAWNIGAVVTKDSGDVGGFAAKREAARDLGLPLIVVRRPPPVPGAFSTFDALLDALSPHLKEPA